MPTKHITRPWVRRHPDGRLSLVDAPPPPHEGGQRCTYVGATRVELPVGPLPEGELFRHLFELGYSVEFCYEPAGLPLYEEVVTPDHDDAKAYALARWQAGTLVVDITNTGGVPLSELGVSFWYNAAPQPAGLGDLPCLSHGGTIGMTPEADYPGTVPPGETATFGLRPEFLDAVRSMTAALSVEQFGVAVHCGERVVTGVDGPALSEVIER